jgi:integrase
MPRKLKLPPGIFNRGGKLYLRYFCKIQKKPRSISLDLLDHPDNYKLAKEYKEKFLQQNKIEFANFLLEEQKSSAAPVYIKDAAREYAVIKRLSVRSIESLEYSVGLLIRYCGNKYITAYTQQDYHNFILALSSQKLSEQSQGLITRTLYAVFNYFVQNEIIPKNPLKVVKAANKKPVAIPEGDLRLILGKLREKNVDAYNFTKFLYLSGFRIGEAIRLTWEDVDFKKETIIVRNQKAKRLDLLPLLSDLKNHLLSLSVTRVGRVFPVYTSIDGLKFFTRIQEDIWGVGNHRYSLHQLRKTFVTKLISEGVHMFHVKTLARHSDIRTTLMFYAEENVNNLRNELKGKVDMGGDNL